MIKPLTEHIEDGLSLTIGTNLFGGFRPANAPDACSVVQETSRGMRATDGTEVQQRPVEITTRNPDYFTAETAAKAIYDLLVNNAGCGLALTGWTILSIVGGPPIFRGQDAKGRFEFSTVLLVRARES